MFVVLMIIVMIVMIVMFMMFVILVMICFYCRYSKATSNSVHLCIFQVYYLISHIICTYINTLIHKYINI